MRQKLIKIVEYGSILCVFKLIYVNDDFQTRKSICIEKKNIIFSDKYFILTELKKEKITLLFTQLADVV